MMNKIILISSGAAVLTAVILSLLVREDSILLLASIAAGLFALVSAAVGCIRPKRPRLRTLAMWLIPSVLFISIARSQFPLRIAFRLHRGEFDQVASLIENGTPPEVPFWIGPFRIKMVGQRGETGTPYVATNTDKSEVVGFVKHPQGHGFNLWSCVTLDESWSYIAED